MKALTVFIVALIVAGCTASTPTKISPNESEYLSFMDTDVFDKNLSKSMSTDTENIHVAITGQVSINEIPDRLGKWLSVVVEKEGRVDVEPKSNTKFIGAVLGLMPTAYRFVKEEIFYGPADDYNATVFYTPETGLIKKVVFRKK